MLEFLKNYPGTIAVNGKRISNTDINEILDKLFGEINIYLTPTQSENENSDIFTTREKPVRDETTVKYNIFVKPWMTKKSTEDFNFMLTWNNNIPMPFRYMCGTINRETSGMYNMTLHGVPRRTETCSVCGKTLTNPISKLFGIGPECMTKCGIFSDITIEQAREKLDEINSRIENTVWTGWIAKSAIMEMVEA